MFLNKGTSQPEASQEKVNGDMASAWEELVELDDVQLATVVGGDGSLVDPEKDLRSLEKDLDLLFKQQIRDLYDREERLINGVVGVLTR